MIIERQRAEWLLLIVAMVAALALAAAGGLDPILFPDSDAYLTFSPSVPAGYPLFVAAIGRKLLPGVQIALYALSAFTLSLAFLRLFHRAWLALLLLVALFINPQSNEFLRSILSEGLFLSIDLLFLTALLVCAVRGNRAAALIAALLAGLAVAVRPISYPLIATVLAAVVLRPRGWTRDNLALALACLLIWGGVLGAERAWSRWYHGAVLTSLTGPHLYAKGVLVDAGTISTTGFDPIERRLAAQAERDYAPVRTMLATQRDTVAYPAMLAYYETCIQHACAEPMRRWAGIDVAAFNRKMARVGLARVRADLPGYIGLTADEYRSLWSLNSRTHPARAAAFDAAVAAARPLPFENKIAQQLFDRTRPSRIAYLVRPAFLALGVLIPLLLLVSGVTMIVRRGAAPLARSILVTSGGIVAMSLFTAFAGIGEGRYTMGLWPGIVATMLLSALVIIFYMPDRYHRLRGVAIA